MNNFSSWLTVVMLTIFTVLVAIATTYPPGAQFMPFTVGIPGILLCLLQLVLDYRAARAGGGIGAPSLESQVVPSQAAASIADPPEFGEHTIRNEIIIWIYLAGYVLGLLFFGFLVSVPVLVFAYLRFEAGARAVIATLAALSTVSVMWFFFERVLQFRLHRGFLTERIVAALTG